MAEFCLDCLNRMDGTSYTKWDVSRSWGKDICEGCGKLCRTVICVKKRVIRMGRLGLYDRKDEKKRR